MTYAMALANWFWITMLLILVFGCAGVWRAKGMIWGGASLLVVFVFILIGCAVFGSPFK